MTKSKQTEFHEKLSHIRHAEQFTDHVCHWPGCRIQVPPAKWGCARHWFQLPKPIRVEIMRTYEIGQEIRKRPSPEYTKAALAAQDWIRAQAAALKGR